MSLDCLLVEEELWRAVEIARGRNCAAARAVSLVIDIFVSPVFAGRFEITYDIDTVLEWPLLSTVPDPTHWDLCLESSDSFLQRSLCGSRAAWSAEALPSTSSASP